jgi:hypothetical protein
MKHRTASLTARTLATIAPACADTCHFDGRRWVSVQARASAQEKTLVPGVHYV